LQRYVTPSQAAVAARIASSDPDRRGADRTLPVHIRHRALAGPAAAGGVEPAARVVRTGK